MLGAKLLNYRAFFLDRAVNFKVGCIYKTFGNKKLNLGRKLKIVGGILIN